MKITYSIGQRCMAYVLLVSFFLQSCTNFSHPITPGQEHTDQNPRENNLEIDKQVSLKLKEEQESNEEDSQEGDEWGEEDYAENYEGLLSHEEVKRDIGATGIPQLGNKQQRSFLEKAINRPNQSMEEADKLENYDYTNLQIPTRPTGVKSLSIAGEPRNITGGLQETYTIDGKRFRRQNVSGKAMRCFFNVAGLGAAEQVEKLIEYQNDPIVRYMIANEIVSAAANPNQLSQKIKDAIKYNLYEFQISDISNLEKGRSAMLFAQSPDAEHQDIQRLPSILQNTSKRDDEAREDLRKKSCSLEAFEAFVNDHIGEENMMVALHDVQGDGKGDNPYANYTSIDAIAYINQLGIKIYQPTDKKLRLAHQFIPASATRVVYLYHSNLHFQTLIPTESKDNEQLIPIKKQGKFQEAQASNLQVPEREETDFVRLLPIKNNLPKRVGEMLPKNPSVAPEGIAISEQKNGKKHLREIEFKEELVQDIAPHLANFKSWIDIPDFVVITGENGSGKTQLLKYIHHMIPKSKDNTSEINVLLRGPDYTNSKISYNKSNPSFFLEEEGRLKLTEELKKYCEWKERNETGVISSRLENEAIYKHIKEKIDGGLVLKSTDQNWKEAIKYCIESYKDYCPKDPNVNEPVLILAQAFSIHEQGNNQLLERYDQPTYAQELVSTYLEKEKKERAIDTFDTFFTQIEDPAYRAELINFYLREKLKRIPLWEEINSILGAYGFTYQADFVGDGNSDKKFILKRDTEHGTIIIKPEDLSSGERLMLDLMSWLFYFRGFSSDGTDPAEIKDIDIMLLDEPDRHLDPKLCEILHKVIYHEFVKKRHIQVILTTHRLDTVILSPENVYTMGKERLKHNIGSAVNRMTTNIIERAVNSRSAASALSGGGLTVIKDVNYVLVENEDDVKFFNIIYKKFLAALPYLSKMTELIFMPVGVSLKDVTEKVKELRSSVDKIGEILSNIQIQDKAKAELENLLSASKELIKTLSEGVDRSGGSSQVKKRVNEIPLYEGKYNKQGKVVEGGHLKKLEGIKHHSQVIWGMIDNDSATRSGKSNAEGNVHAIDEVYSFENYLCMPLNLFYFMKEYEKKEQNKPEINTKDHPFAKTLLYWAVLKNIPFSHPLKDIFKNFKEEEASQKDLQKISDQVIEYLRERYKKQEKGPGSFFTEADFSQEKRVELSLINGEKIRCPKLFFTTRGHDLLKEISAIILDKKDESKMQKLLFDTLERMPVGFLPKKLLSSIERLQNSEEISRNLTQKEGDSHAKGRKKPDNNQTLAKIVEYLAKGPNESKLQQIILSENSMEKIELVLPGLKQEGIIHFCTKQLKMKSEQIQFSKDGTGKLTLTLSNQEQVEALQESIKAGLQTIALEGSGTRWLQPRAVDLQALITKWLQI